MRKCTALGNRDASSCKGQLSGTSSDILNNLEFERTEQVQTNYINPNDLNDVKPLLYNNTNEYQISHSGVTHYGSHLNVDASHLPPGRVSA